MRPLLRLLSYFRAYAGRMAAAALSLAASGVLMAAVVATLKPLTNLVLFPGRSETPQGGILENARRMLPLDRWLRSDDALVQVPLLLLAVFVLCAALLYFGQYLTTYVGASIIRDLRSDLYEAVTRQSRRFFHATPTGTILSRILNDVQRLQAVGTRQIADLVRVSAMAPALLLVAFVHDWRMSSIALLALPLLGYPMVRLGRRLRRAATRSQERMAELAGQIHESVQGVAIVQGFGREAFELDRFRNGLERMLRADLKAGRAAALAPAVMVLAGALVGSTLFWAAGTLIARGELDHGNFVVVLFSLGLLYTSLRRLNTIHVELQQGAASAERVFDLLDREREIRDRPGAIELSGFADRIVFDRVSFSYGDEPALDDISLELPRGRTLALVGRSGSGKTTLALLLPRFYDPDEGRVLIDGHDLRDVRLDSLRGLIGLVTQDAVLFDDTVRNNIAYGRDDVPDAAILDAARAANAHEFIERLPRGYDNPLGERGTHLSAGQRQRLTIARALLADPPLLVLDEATAALDTESESLVQRALDRLMQGRTCLVIAHRLSTVRRADRIAVLDRGRLVESGDHEQLLARGGLYARLHDLQFEDRPP